MAGIAGGAHVKRKKNCKRSEEFWHFSMLGTRLSLKFKPCKP
jgi:hypothetical protein